MQNRTKYFFFNKCIIHFALESASLPPYLSKVPGASANLFLRAVVDPPSVI